MRYGESGMYCVRYNVNGVPLLKTVYTQYSNNKDSPLVTMHTRYLMSLEALIWSLPA
jgi:hypothetical protein